MRPRGWERCLAILWEARVGCVVLVPGKAVLGATTRGPGFHFSVTYLVCSLFSFGGTGTCSRERLRGVDGRG